MLTVTLVIQRRVTQAIRRTLTIPSSPLNQILFNFNFLCTQTPLNFPEKILDESKQEKPSCLSYRIEKLPKGELAGLAFQSWMGDGFPIHRGDIFHTINRLRKLKMNKRALEVTLSLLECHGYGFLFDIKIEFFIFFILILVWLPRKLWRRGEYNGMMTVYDSCCCGSYIK